MRYRILVMAAVPALAGMLSMRPDAAGTPQREPSAAQIDAALAYAHRDAGLPPAAAHRPR
jgi:hypothetical protein